MALTLLLGCGDRASFRGEWQGRRNLPAAPGSDPAMMGTLAKVKLKVDPNDRFLMVDGGVPKEGEVEYGGDGATLVVKRVVGQKVAEERYGLAKERGGLSLTLGDEEILLKPLDSPNRNQ